MKTLRILTLMVGILTLSLSALASPDMDDEQGPVVGWQAVRHHVGERAGVKVLLPSQFPPLGKTRYAYITQVDKQGYTISLDAKDDCYGAKYCQVASFSAERGGLPTIHFDMNNREMTQRVTLSQQIHGYYTEGFALASFSPPVLVFRCGDTLYRFTWNEPNVDSQQRLTSLAKAALSQADCR